MSMTAHGKTKLRSHQEQLQAVELRTRGYSYPQIADYLNIKISKAKDLVRRAHKRILQNLDESTEELVRVELLQIDGCIKLMNERIQGTIDNPHLPSEGLARNIEILLKCFERKSKLMGLDAPEKTHSVTIGVDLSSLSPEELRHEAAKVGLLVESLVNPLPQIPEYLPGEVASLIPISVAPMLVEKPSLE